MYHKVNLIIKVVHLFSWRIVNQISPPKKIYCLKSYIQNCVACLGNYKVQCSKDAHVWNFYWKHVALMRRPDFNFQLWQKSKGVKKIHMYICILLKFLWSIFFFKRKIDWSKWFGIFIVIAYFLPSLTKFKRFFFWSKHKQL